MGRYFTIASAMPIKALGDINGPLTTPVQIPYADILDMLRKNYVIYEHNPVNKAEKVRVTIDNVNNVKFTTSRYDALLLKEANLEMQELSKPLGNIIKENKVEQRVNSSKNINSKKADSNSDSVEVILPDAFTKHKGS